MTLVSISYRIDNNVTTVVGFPRNWHSRSPWGWCTSTETCKGYT